MKYKTANAQPYKNIAPHKMLSEIMSLDETSANAENSSHKMARILVSATHRQYAPVRLVDTVANEVIVAKMRFSVNGEPTSKSASYELIPFLFLSFSKTETELPRAEGLINEVSSADHAHDGQALK